MRYPKSTSKMQIFLCNRLRQYQSQGFTTCLLADTASQFIQQTLHWYTMSSTHHPWENGILPLQISLKVSLYNGVFELNISREHLSSSPPGKMAAILQTTFSNAFSWMKMYWFQLKIIIKFVPKGLINNIPVLVQMMAWHQLGNKSSSEPMI